MEIPLGIGSSMTINATKIYSDEPTVTKGN